jgi:hypothetical protein
MSFILAEVDALGLSKNSTLIQNIINSGIEEEKETEKGESEHGKEVFLFFEALHHQTVLFHVGELCNKSLNNLLLNSGYKKTFSPPPEA